MNYIIKIIKSFFVSSLSFFFIGVATVYAETQSYDYIPLEALPGVSKEGTNLSSYLSAIFNIGIGLAGALAVLMIVVGGIGYIAGASNPSARSEAKKKITDAIIGLILAMASWLILYTVNPDLLKNKLKITPISIASPKTDTKQVDTIVTKIPALQQNIKTYNEALTKLNKTQNLTSAQSKYKDILKAKIKSKNAELKKELEARKVL